MTTIQATAQPIDPAALARRFACPHPARMLWRPFGQTGFECHGCPARCGMGGPGVNRLFATARQGDFFQAS